MIVVWTPEAQQDRIDTWDFIAAENPLAAMHMDELFSNVATGLEEYPRMGRRGIVPGTLELIPHEKYRLVYEIEGDRVWILSLVHTARLWPPLRP